MFTPFMPRKPLYEELSGAVDFFVRQAGGKAVPLPAPVHNRAAGGRPQADRGIDDLLAGETWISLFSLSNIPCIFPK